MTRRHPLEIPTVFPRRLFTNEMGAAAPPPPEPPLLTPHPTLRTTLYVFQEHGMASRYWHTGIAARCSDGTAFRADYRLRFNWPLIAKLSGIKQYPTLRPIDDWAAFESTLFELVPIQEDLDVDPADLKALLLKTAEDHHPVFFNCRDYCRVVIEKMQTKTRSLSAAPVLQWVDTIQSHDRRVIVAILIVLVLIGILVGLCIYYWRKSRASGSGKMMGQSKSAGYVNRAR